MDKELKRYGGLVYAAVAGVFVTSQLLWYLRAFGQSYGWAQTLNTLLLLGCILLLFSPGYKRYAAAKKAERKPVTVRRKLGLAALGVALAAWLCFSFWFLNYGRYRADENEAKALFRAGRTEEAWHPALRALPGGDPEIMFIVGEGWMRAEANSEPVKRGFELVREAAHRGFGPAQFLTAVAYGRGAGVDTDPVESFRWMERAAKSGIPAAVGMLGAKYLEGNGTLKDPARGMGLLRAAAQMGDEFAIGFLKSREQENAAGDPPAAK